MSWSRFDDRADEAPKMLVAMGDVGDAAWAMWSRAILYCNRHETDGEVPMAVLPRLTTHKSWKTVRDALLRAGCFEPTEHGVRVHDFLQWNESRAQLCAKRDAAKTRMKGARSHDVRANNNRTESEPPETFAGSSDAVRSPSPLLSSPEREHTHSARADAGASADAREREARPVEPRPVPERSPMSAEAGQVLDALRGHEVLGPVADVRFAETLDGRRAGRPVAWVVRAIADAAADTPGGETAQAIQRRVRAYCDRARSPDAERATTARSGPAMQAVVPEGTGWKANEARLRAEQEAWLREAGKDAPL
jgi:hypothetical protein